MAEIDPVTGEQLLEMVETYHRRIAELSRQVKEHPDRLPEITASLQMLIDGGLLVQYYQIEGLIVIGPHEWEKAVLGPKGENPLNLASGWCPQIPVPYTVAQMRKLAEICKSREWATTPVLWLALPKVGDMPTSLVNQYGWWGVPHDNLGPGQIRSDIQWSSWFVEPKYDWALEPAVTGPTWMIGYEFPRWTIRLNWNNQQDAARKRKMLIATAYQDAMMCNLVAITTGKKFRTSTYSRTATICDGNPLHVYWNLDRGLNVYQSWRPGFAYDNVGASVEGIPVELGL